VTPSFPQARYVVQRKELEFARHTNERTAASYLPPNFERVPFTFIDGKRSRSRDPLPPDAGARALSPVGIGRERRGAGVLPRGSRPDERPPSAPLDHGVRLGAARDPRVEATAVCTAEADGWLLFFEHDSAVIAGRLGRDGKAFALVDPLVAG